MKTVITSLVGLCFLAGLAGHADAANYKKKKRLQGNYYSKPYPKAYSYRSDDDDSYGGYYEHRLDAVRFGSKRWWRIYEEQNGGRRR